MRATESRSRLVECFDPETNTCPIATVCGLKGILREAGDAFDSVLSKYTLADVLETNRLRYSELFLPRQRPPQVLSGDGETGLE